MERKSLPTARSLTLPYAIMGIGGWFYLIYLPSRFHATGDASASARAIVAGELTYRLCVFAGLVSSVAFLMLALALYDAFKDVDRRQARLLVALVTASAAIGAMNLVNDLAVLYLASGRPAFSSLARPQLESVGMLFVSLRGAGVHVDSAFWGLWLLPFGVLAWKSRVIPRAIGLCLLIGGAAYIAMSVTGIVFPRFAGTMARIVMPLYALGELPIFAWLLFRGQRVTLPFQAPTVPAPSSM